MKEPTQRQREVLSFVADYIAEHNFPPTIREIASYFHISVKGAYDHISALKKKGYVKYKHRQARTMELVSFEKTAHTNKDLISVPLLGVIAAGNPSITEENYDGFITLHNSILKKHKTYFALKVRGDSMNHAGILDGDTAIVEKEAPVKNGEIAVVLIEDKVTLKRFYKENSQIRLQAENPEYKPIYAKEKEGVQILGRLATVIRSYQ